MNSVHNSGKLDGRTSRENTRDGILNAARDMFARDGYEGFSMRRLADDLG